MGDVDVMLLDSDTTSHMTPMFDKVKKKNDCRVYIMLCDHSKVTAFSIGTRLVKWQTRDGPCTVSLSNNLVTEDLSMSLISIPVLVQKKIATLFLPGKALLIDLEDNLNILGMAYQGDEGMFYITDEHKSVSGTMAIKDKKLRAMMAVVKKNASIPSNDK